MAEIEPDPDCPGCQALQKRVAVLEQQVEKLKALLEQSSSNSNRPPSSDPPWSKRSDKQRKKGKRGRGGQPGHLQSVRVLLPTEEVDRVERCKPSRCGFCGEALWGDDPEPRRHQITEIPPIRPQTVEVQLHELTCSMCGESTRASLPEGVPSGAFGARLQATVAVLTGAYRVSRRNVRQLMSDFFGVTISLGAVSNLERLANDALEGSYEEALGHVRAEQASVHADETSWREAGQKSWIWVGVSAKATAFMVRQSRSGAVAKELLGEEPNGTLISDRWSGYNWVGIEQRQLCWAHLIRDFRKIAESGKGTEIIGECLEDAANELFGYWHRVRDGTLARSTFRRHAAQLRKRMQRLLELGAERDTWRGPGICRGILKLEPAMWTFVHEQGIEPTNNAAEQAIRPAVIWRKTSLGSQSRRGSDFVERMLTCVSTLRRKGRNVLDYVHDACVAREQGRPAPALIP
jgi:transposase